MRKMLLVVGGCGLVALLCWGHKIMWVGNTDLTVEFVVTDAETGQPLSGAEIVILSEGGFYEDGHRLRERGEQREEFFLKTGPRGTTEYVCRDSMCSGTTQALGLLNTFAVHMPYWHITVSAPGYSTTARFYLDAQLGRNVQRTGPKQSKVVVPVALNRGAK